MRISAAGISKGVPPTTHFENPRKYPDRSLQTVAESISKRTDIETISVAMSALCLDALQRIIDVRSDLDRARELKTANDPSWKNAMRTARFACRDEGKLLSLVNQAIRGLCECMGMRTRISFEEISKINARKYPDPSEELRRELTRLLCRNAMLEKAYLFKFTLPEILWTEEMKEEMKKYVDDKIKKSHS
ncbi:MAG TPA: hypothetical protein VNI36_07250 [Candidatus Dormibacteraeota bacterium]|nr:hypothetical protein [Candidatus Dormibacteraeota bacterium]